MSNVFKVNNKDTSTMPAVLELKEMDFEEVILFLMELFAAILIFILFIPVFKWLFMLTILITESCL